MPTAATLEDALPSPLPEHRAGSDRESAALQTRRLLFFFAVTYFAQKFAQRGGLIAQPLTVYFKNTLYLAPVQFDNYFWLLGLPWVIKPLYGLLSDFVPLRGYRRKSYLLLMSAAATVGFCAVAGFQSPTAIVVALFVSSTGIAFIDVVTDAVMVEAGQRLGRIKQFQSQQWLWFSVAAIPAFLLAGYLSQNFLPLQALHTAAVVTALAPLAVLLASWFLVAEEKQRAEPALFRAAWSGVQSALLSRSLRMVVLFLALWYFSPGLGTPLQYHLRDNLKLSESALGVLNATAAVGSALGALGFMFLARCVSTKRLIVLGTVSGSVATLGFLWLSGIGSALLLFFLAGLTSTFATLSLLSLAAEACPLLAAGVTFATLASVINFTENSAGNLGARLYEQVFAQQLGPLIWTSALFTLATLFFVPLLPTNHPAPTAKPR